MAWVYIVRKLVLFMLAVSCFLQSASSMDLGRFEDSGHGSEDNKKCMDENCSLWRVGRSFQNKRGTNCPPGSSHSKICKVFLGKRQQILDDIPLNKNAAEKSGYSQLSIRTLLDNCSPNDWFCRFRTGGKKKFVVDKVSDGEMANAVQREAYQLVPCKPAEIGCRTGKRTDTLTDWEARCLGKGKKPNPICRWRGPGKKDEISLPRNEARLS